MASTFGGVTFYTERNGSTLPGTQAQSEIARTHVPGSNVNIIDIGGLREETVSRRIVIARANLASWLALRNTVAELVLNGSSKGSCLLAALVDHEAEANDEYDFFTAEWIVGA